MASGYILSETKDIVVIATLESENDKTGNMIQVWIMPTAEAPHKAIKSGLDRIVCGDCQHRPSNDGTCYVTTFQAPLSVWSTWQRGGYAFLPVSGYAAVFGGRKVRLGAWGDPAFMPQRIVRAIVRTAAGWTGYTHQWRRASAAWLKGLVMASCDSPADYSAAQAAGWRTFRVSAGLAPLPGEILCPASDEAGKRTQCIRCGLCNGRKADDPRKSIYIPVHGSKAARFTETPKALIQIGAAA